MIVHMDSNNTAAQALQLSIELKLWQELAALEQVPLHGVFIDLTKACDTTDRPRALESFKEYGMGPKMQRLLEAHWAGQLMIAKEQGFYGSPFGTSRGMTQGSKFSPSAFNIIVDKVVRYWLALVLEDDGGAVVLDGLGLTVKE